MTERERYRFRGQYYMNMGDWQKCVEEYTELMERYPVDRVGQNNLASCLASARRAPEAVEAARRAVALVPKGALPALQSRVHQFVCTVISMPANVRHARR